jgi:hypothetical protein
MQLNTCTRCHTCDLTTAHRHQATNTCTCTCTCTHMLHVHVHAHAHVHMCMRHVTKSTLTRKGRQINISISEDHHRPTTRHRTPSRTPRFHCRRTAACASRASCDSVVARARCTAAAGERPRRSCSVRCQCWTSFGTALFSFPFRFSTHFSPPPHPSLRFF